MTQTTAPPQPPVQRKKWTLTQKWVAVGIVVAFFAILGAATNNDSDKSTSSSSDKTFTAFEMCKKSVRNDLKAPSTAKFRDYFGDQAPSVSGTGDGPYTVISTVDSQNGFGAMIRSRFVCTAEYIGSDQWSVSSTLG
jgi:hypothetical protein